LGTPIPHATCPTYIDNLYTWTDVELLGYNSENGKFLVKILKTGV